MQNDVMKAPVQCDIYSGQNARCDSKEVDLLTLPVLKQTVTVSFIAVVGLTLSVHCNMVAGWHAFLHSRYQVGVHCSKGLTVPVWTGQSFDNRGRQPCNAALPSSFAQTYYT